MLNIDSWGRNLMLDDTKSSHREYRRLVLFEGERPWWLGKIVFDFQDFVWMRQDAGRENDRTHDSLLLFGRFANCPRHEHPRQIFQC